MDTHPVPRLSPSTAWADLQLPPELRDFLSRIAPGPYDFLATPLPALRKRGVKRDHVLAVLRSVSAVAGPIEEPPDLGGQALDPIVFPKLRPGLTWADLHIPLDAMALLADIAQSPLALAGKPTSELLSWGLKPKVVKTVIRQFERFASRPARPADTGLLYPSHTVFSEELHEWLGSRTRVPQQLRSKRLPGLPVGGWTTVIGLHPATRSFLGRVLSRRTKDAEAQLAQRTLGDLIDAGATWEMLADVVARIEDAGQRKWPILATVTRDEVTRTAEALNADPVSRRISADDIRFGPLIRHIALEARSARDAAVIAASIGRSNAGMPKRLDRVYVLHRLVHDASRMLLEDELGDIVMHSVPPGSAAAVLTALGWDGRPPQSIKVAAKRGCTSFQWISSALRQFKVAIAGRDVFAPALERALAATSALADAEIPTALRDQRCSATPFAAESLRRAEALLRTNSFANKKIRS